MFFFILCLPLLLLRPAGSGLGLRTLCGKRGHVRERSLAFMELTIQARNKSMSLEYWRELEAAKGCGSYTVPG